MNHHCNEELNMNFSKIDKSESKQDLSKSCLLTLLAFKGFASFWGCSRFAGIPINPIKPALESHFGMVLFDRSLLKDAVDFSVD